MNLMATTPQSLPATYQSVENDILHKGTWNINGGNNGNKRELIDEILKSNRIVVECLQEVKIPTESLEPKTTYGTAYGTETASK
jgi:exonuclease III